MPLPAAAPVDANPYTGMSVRHQLCRRQRNRWHLPARCRRDGLHLPAAAAYSDARLWSGSVKRSVRRSVSECDRPMYGVHHTSMSCAVHLSAAAATAVRAASRRYVRRPMSEPKRPMYGVHLFCMPCAVHLSAAAYSDARLWPGSV